MAVRPLYESKQLRLVIKIPPDLPLLYMDETRMRQVLLNLVSNAGRFTDRGGVEVVARVERDEVIVSVTDTGPGISPTDQERIFEPFRQAGSSNLRRHGGTGLGLSISKRFVELHGGRMWVESELGRGSTFCFAIPRLVAPTEDDAAVMRWFNPYQGSGHSRRSSIAQLSAALPRYVILDPSHAVARRLARCHDELEVVSVETPEQATKQIARLPARALIVNDPTVRSQHLDIAWLNSLPLGTPAFVCHVAGEREMATRLGVTRYLIKPVIQEDLVAALERLGPNIETVLIVDDNSEAVQLFSRMLTATGRRYRVLRALNGERALALLRSRRPDVMLLDLVMPGKSGYDILEEKQRDPDIRDIPAIAISAQDLDQGSLDAGILTIVQSGGLLRGNLLDAILQISAMLAPAPGADRGQG